MCHNRMGKVTSRPATSIFHTLLLKAVNKFYKTILQKSKSTEHTIHTKKVEVHAYITNSKHQSLRIMFTLDLIIAVLPHMQTVLM